MSHETFAQELAAVRSRGDQFQQRAQQAVEDEALLPEALEELSTALEAMRAYAAMLSQLIGSATDARHKGQLAAQLQLALESRVLIEQAKGVLMERHDLDDQAAFTRLRRQARSSSRKLTDLAREIIGDPPRQP